MGLLTDTYSDILKKLQGVNLRDENDFSGMDSDFNDGSGFKVSLRDRKTPEGAFDSAPGFIKGPVNYFVPPGTEKTGQVKIPFTDKSIRVIPESAMSNARTVDQKQKSANLAMGQISNIPKQDASKTVKTEESSVIPIKALSQDQSFLQKMSSLAGIDFNKAADSWKDKGGFEGLMANPAFTLGLAFLQAGAEGKTIGGAGLDSILKAGAISQQYKKIVEGKAEVLEVTASDVSDMKSELENYGFADPNSVEQLFGKIFKGIDSQKAFDKAAEKMALEYKKQVRSLSKDARKKGKDFVVDSDLRKKIIEDIIRKEKLKVKKGLLPFGITKGTILADKSEYTIPALEHGGTAHAGKAHLVGEAGPEVFIPKETGEVVANDDSQVFAMLLASNPQLQKVSKERAMKILKAKFPEYFD